MDTHICACQHCSGKSDIAAQRIMNVVTMVILQDLRIASNPKPSICAAVAEQAGTQEHHGPGYLRVLQWQRPPYHGRRPNHRICVVRSMRPTRALDAIEEQEAASAPAHVAAGAAASRGATGVARADAVTTAVVVFAAKDFTARTARATAHPGQLLLTGPAPVRLLTGSPPVLLLEAAPRLLLLPAPPGASPPAIATTAVVVSIAKDYTTRRQTTSTAARLLLLTGSAPQLLLTAPPAQLLLEGPPARLLLKGPLAGLPPAITTAVVVFTAKDLTERGRAPSAAVRPLRLTWLAPPPVLLLAAPPTRLLHQAPPTSDTMTSVAVVAFVKQDLAPWAARLMTRLQLPAGLPIRPIEPHPRLLLRRLPAASLPPTISTNFAGRSSLMEDDTEQPASTTARPLLLTWPASVQPVTAPCPVLLEVRSRIPEDLTQGLSLFLGSMSQMLMQDCFLLIATSGHGIR